MCSWELSPEQRQTAGNYNKGFTQEQRTFASGEVLAAQAYSFSSMGDACYGAKVPLLQPDGSWKTYICDKLEASNGIHAYLLMPEDGSKDVKLIFRGTYGFSSLKRDFELEGPGSESLRENQAFLIQQLQTKINAKYGYFFGNGIKLTVAGHSLGASDAENFSSYLLEDMATGSKWSKVNELEVFSFNSPGISHNRAQKSVEALESLQQQRTFTASVHFAKAQNDLIQRLGESHLLKDAKPAQAHIDLIEIQKRHEIALPSNPNMDAKSMAALGYELIKRAALAHMLDSYYTPDRFGRITIGHESPIYLSNQNPKHRAALKAELEDKAHYLLGIYKYAVLTMINVTSSIYGWVYPNDQKQADTAIADKKTNASWLPGFSALSKAKPCSLETKQEAKAAPKAHWFSLR